MKTGLSKDTIRYYDKLGLLDFETGNRQINNYRDYPDDIFDRLFLIKQAKSLGFTLNEICRIFKKWEDNSLSMEEKTRLFTGKMETIDHKIAELLQVKTDPNQKLMRLSGKCADKEES